MLSVKDNSVGRSLSGTISPACKAIEESIGITWTGVNAVLAIPPSTTVMYVLLMDVAYIDDLMSSMSSLERDIFSTLSLIGDGVLEESVTIIVSFSVKSAVFCKENLLAVYVDGSTTSLNVRSSLSELRSRVKLRSFGEVESAVKPVLTMPGGPSLTGTTLFPARSWISPVRTVM